MEEPPATDNKEAQSLPWSSRIILTVAVSVACYFYVALLYGIFFYLGDQFAFVAVAPAVIYALIFPHLKYRKNHHVLYPVLFFLAWFLVVTLLTLPLVKQFELAVAKQVVPVYPNAQLLDTEFPRISRRSFRVSTVG